MASEAEYLEIAVTVECNAAHIAEALDRALPDGLDIVEVVVARDAHLQDRIDASQWQIELDGVGNDAAEEAVTALLALDSVPVVRTTKDGERIEGRFQARRQRCQRIKMPCNRWRLITPLDKACVFERTNPVRQHVRADAGNCGPQVRKPLLAAFEAKQYLQGPAALDLRQWRGAGRHRVIRQPLPEPAASTLSTADGR